MLPPPFNLITALALPFHFIHLFICKRQLVRKLADDVGVTEASLTDQISIGGTVADITIGVFMSFVAPILELIIYLFSLSQGKIFTTDSINFFEQFVHTAEAAIIVVTSPLWYFAFVSALLYKVGTC